MENINGILQMVPTRNELDNYKIILARRLEEFEKRIKTLENGIVPNPELVEKNIEINKRLKEIENQNEILLTKIKDFETRIKEKLNKKDK